MENKNLILATGRRKTSIAQIRINIGIGFFNS